MNILVLSPTYFPLRGGTEQVLFEVTKRLKRDNHNVTVLAMQWEGLKQFEVINNIEIFRINTTEVKGISLLLYSLSFLLTAIKLNRKKKFDLIHMFHIYKVGFGGFLIKKFLKIPLITTLAGWDTYDPIKKIVNRHVPFIKIAMNSSDFITAPSNHLAGEGNKQGCKKEIQVVPHGSNMHEKVNSKYLDIKALLRIQSNIMILSVQRLSPRKGLLYLLEAIPNIKYKKDITFVIVGTGREEKKFKQLTEKLKIQSQVIFTGFVSDEDLPSYYAAADLFVLPTLYEAFGLVYVDALCFGLPIVTTVNGGSMDIVNKDNGILVPAKDPVKLSVAIIEALNKNWDKDKIKRGAEKYRWDTIYGKYMKLYESVTNK